MPQIIDQRTVAQGVLLEELWWQLPLSDSYRHEFGQAAERAANLTRMALRSEGVDDAAAGIGSARAVLAGELSEILPSTDAEEIATKVIGAVVLEEAKRQPEGLLPNSIVRLLAEKNCLSRLQATAFLSTW